VQAGLRLPQTFSFECWPRRPCLLERVFPETIASSNRIQGGIYCHALFQVWWNPLKPASERDP